jgi:ketosteroid isomerase-like protein
VGPDTAREIGRFSLDARNPKKQWTKLDGKYVVVWKQVGGKWMLDVDIWNTNR